MDTIITLLFLWCNVGEYLSLHLCFQHDDNVHNYSSWHSCHFNIWCRYVTPQTNFDPGKPRYLHKISFLRNDNYWILRISLRRNFQALTRSLTETLWRHERQGEKNPQVSNLSHWQPSTLGTSYSEFLWAPHWAVRYSSQESYSSQIALLWKKKKSLYFTASAVFRTTWQHRWAEPECQSSIKCINRVDRTAARRQEDKHTESKNKRKWMN